MTRTTEAMGLADTLVRLTRLVQQVFADASRLYGLTPAQAQLLCALISGPIGMSELCRHLHLEKSSLTGLVDRVERRGLVTRTRDDHDRRACQIALTDQGARTGQDCHQEVMACLEALAGDVSPADRQQLTVVLGRMVGGPPERAVPPVRRGVDEL